MCSWRIVEENLKIEEQIKKDKSIIYKISPKIYKIMDDIEMHFYKLQHPYSIYTIPKIKS